MLFEVKFKKYSFKKLKKLLKKYPALKDKIDEVYEKLKNNPFDQTLKTHKVNSRRFGLRYSSSITQDLRFIWDFDTKTGQLKIIQIFDIGGHSGVGGVY